MSEGSAQVVTRFAPSPTGALHVGGARTALFNWAYARHFKGQFIIRIEDTDQARSTAQSTRGILEDLKWLGIDYDQGPDENAADPYTTQKGDRGPYFQSQRLATYREHCDRLLAAGRAYECFKTSAELASARDKAKAEKRDYKYDPAESLAVPKEQREAWKAEGKPFVVRFHIAGRDVVLQDQVLGEVVVKSEQLEDFVIFKGDGFPTYHFAVVVDDALMGVTHVIRAQEHLSNTPKHVALQEALGFGRPTYAHLPLIFNPDGTKMSKRDKAKVARAAAKGALSDTITTPSMSVAMADVVLQRAKVPAGTFLERVPVIITQMGEYLLKYTFKLSEDHKLPDPKTLSQALEEFLNDFLAKKNDNVDLAKLLAGVLDISLPEIDVADFRKSGYLPGVILNYIALLGWNPGENVERFDLPFLVERFGFDRVGKSNSKFDREKLKAFNGEALRKLMPPEFEAMLREYGNTYQPEAMARLGANFQLFAASYRERCAILNDPFVLGRFFFIDDDAMVFDAKAVDKVLKKDGGAGVAALRGIVPVLETIATWDAGAIHAAIEAHATQAGIGMGNIAQPLRVAVTGSTVSPAIHDTLAILGKEATLNRIARCVALYSPPS